MIRYIAFDIMIDRTYKEGIGDAHNGHDHEESSACCSYACDRVNNHAQVEEWHTDELGAYKIEQFKVSSRLKSDQRMP